MFIFLMINIILFFITSMIMMLASFISKKKNIDKEKNSPFECGFEPFNSSRLPFSLHFFLIAIIFLIFDVELTLMLPMIWTMKINNMIIWAMTSLFFIIILILGLFHEWNQGALEWNS